MSGAYKVTFTKGLKVFTPEDHTECPDLPSALRKAAELMEASPEGQTVDRITIRSHGGHGWLLFVARWTPEGRRWKGQDDQGYAR